MSARTPNIATQKGSSGQKGQFRNSGPKKFPLIHHSQKVAQVMTTGASIFAGESGYDFPIVSFDLVLRSPYELGLACLHKLLADGSAACHTCVSATMIQRITRFGPQRNVNLQAFG
jgi:hypothetical protein